MAEPWLSPPFPQFFERSSFSYEPRSGSVVDISDGGAPISTTLFTGFAVDVQGILIVNTAQAQQFLNWWRVNLSQGALPFTWIDPVYETPADFCFNAPKAAPRLVPHGAAFDITLNLIQLPQ